MIRRLAPLLAVPVLLLTVGCSQVGDAAKDIASSAASEAGSAAVAELREQICAPLKDGQISEQDQQILSGLLTAADAAGVASEFITPLKEIAAAGDDLPADSVAALQEACDLQPTDTEPTPSPSNG